MILTKSMRDHLESLRVLDVTEDYIGLLLNEMDKDNFISSIDFNNIIKFVIEFSNDPMNTIDEISKRPKYKNIIDFIKEMRL